MDPSPPFAALLKQRRKALDLTQRQLADRIGCATVTVQRIEQGSLRPSNQIVRRLADIFELPVDERDHFLRLARGNDLTDTLAPTTGVHSSRAPLPIPLTPLIGRAREVAAVCDTLEDSPTRIVTLTGPGGIGKTRLAHQIAADLASTFVDGIFFVDLAALNDADVVLTSIARTLELPENVGQALIENLKVFLGDKHLLLVLDNFEHVIEAAPLVATLLQTASRLKVLLTSRVVVGISGEQVIEVPPLICPDTTHVLPLEQLREYEAIRLFTERVQARQAGFAVAQENAAAITAICQQLEGVPLAIELAAARCTVLEPEELLARLNHQLQFLRGGTRSLPPRQQTMRATIDWSYQLLTEGEQRLFMRLAVFVGSWTLDAAEEVCDTTNGLDSDVLEGLHSLMDKHLVGLEVVHPPRGSVQRRFRRLATIQEYARERLDASGERDVWLRRHASYYLALTEAAAPALLGPDVSEWLEQLERDQDNIHAALQWTLDRGESELGLRLATALHGFWLRHGQVSDGCRALEAALNLHHTAPAAVRVRALIATISLAHAAGNRDHIRSYAEEALSLSEQIGDRWGIANALLELGRTPEALRLFQDTGETRGIAVTLLRAGCEALVVGEYATAYARLKESLGGFRQVGGRAEIAQVLEQLASVAREQGTYTQAHNLFEEGVALSRQVGNKLALAWHLHSWAEMALLQGDHAAAQEHAEESLALFRAAGNKRGMACVLHNLGYVAQYQDALEDMERFFVESLQLFQEQRVPAGIVHCLAGLAGASVHRQLACGTCMIEEMGQDRQRAARLFGAIEALRQAHGIQFWRLHQVEMERNVACARELMDDTTWAAAWAEGQVMTLEQTIEYAMEEISDT